MRKDLNQSFYVREGTEKQNNTKNGEKFIFFCDDRKMSMRLNYFK